MPTAPASPQSKPKGAVFLSYASQDAQAARRIGEGLRAAGIEVWFDESELRGGDAWDHGIRTGIHDCTLFIPVISAHTQARPEGYFRLEWKLAVERSHLMAAERAFLLPVVVDSTSAPAALVPERFRELQWTYLPEGATSREFIDRVLRLLAQPLLTRQRDEAATPGVKTRRRDRLSLWVAAASAAIVILYVAVEHFPWRARPNEGVSESVAISEKSIAVLPFADLSEHGDQEYFSDGLAEELLDLLTKTQELQVTARTSSFYYKGRQATVPEIARTLRVAHVLEGSVRKSGNKVRVTTELIRARDGVHLWSETYDRNLDDVFQVQDDIANAVVKALQVRLLASTRLANLRRAIDPGANPRQGMPVSSNGEAYYQYLLGRGLQNRGNADGWPLALAAFRKAIALDPGYAPAYARLAIAENFVADRTNDVAGFQRAVAAADRAVALAPDIPDGYAARAFMRYTYLWDWKGAEDDLNRAIELDPNDATVQRRYGDLLDTLGRVPEAIAATRRAIEADPLSALAWQSLGLYLYSSGHMSESRQALERSFEINPEGTYIHWHLGVLELLTSHPAAAMEHFRQLKASDLRLAGAAIAQHALGHGREAHAALDELIRTLSGEAADQIAEIYAWFGEPDQAFEWLNRAFEQRDGGISDIKTDPLFASLRQDPRYVAMLRKLALPL